MWKISLGFFGHRTLLFLIALMTLYIQIQSHKKTGKVMPLFFETVRAQADNQYYAQLQNLSSSEVLSRTSHPFYWLASVLSKITRQPMIWVAIFLTNIFFFFYLSEVFSIFTRMCSEEVAVTSTLLIALWPSTISYHFGNPFVFLILFVMLSLRAAMDNQWLLSGVSLALTMWCEPLTLMLFPLLVYIFWYFQRHFLVKMVFKRLAFLTVPVLFVLVWKFSVFIRFPSFLHNPITFLSTLSFTPSFILQTLTGILIIIGGITASIANSIAIHRVIPAYFVLLFLLFASNGSMIQKAPLAAVCFQGLSNILAPLIMRFFQTILIYFGCQRIFDAFSQVASR